MLEHVFHHVQSVMGGFCNLQDTSEIDYAIRKTALSISKEESEGIDLTPRLFQWSLRNISPHSPQMTIWEKQ